MEYFFIKTIIKNSTYLIYRDEISTPYPRRDISITYITHADQTEIQSTKAQINLGDDQQSV